MSASLSDDLCPSRVDLYIGIPSLEGALKGNDMKSIIRRVLLTATFSAGLVVPLAATWTTPVQAFADCAVSAGSDSWTGTNADGTTFTVSVSWNLGVSVTGTPPPLASLPISLVSSTGNALTITAGPNSTRKYSGTFTGVTPATCNCPGLRCDWFDIKCVPQPMNTCRITSYGTCIYSGCNGGGGGSCSGGRCTGPANFSAAI